MSNNHSEVATPRRRFIKKIACGHLKVPVIAVAFAAGLGAALSACALAESALFRVSALPLESTQLGILECGPSKGTSAAASSSSGIVDAYLRIHADVRADATIAGVPGGSMTGGAAAAPASNCTGEETSVPQAVEPHSLAQEE